MGQPGSLKPIFHYDAKPFEFTSGTGVGGTGFALPIPTCWYLKTLIFPLIRNIKFALPPMPTPNTSQWNIGCVGY